MSNFAISAEGLGKRYRLGLAKEPATTSGEAISRLLSAPFRNFSRLRRLTAFGNADEADVLWALRDVSFELKHGDVLGVIGNNGAGKSTLLKILSRITRPTTGRALVHGRIGSLLEVGIGFNPELTGRENIFLNGSILGMDRQYIKRRFDEIVEFSGVEKFLDTPTKRYSSGMYVRLAFAVAAHLEPDILVVDEVLAVGDAEFQARCIGKMAEVSRGGRTVIFVSHNLVAVQGLCERALWLSGGQVMMDGETSPVVAAYLARAAAATARPFWRAEEATDSGNESVQMLWASVRPEHGEPGDVIDVHTAVVVEFALKALDPRVTLWPRLQLINRDQLPVFKHSPPTVPEHGHGSVLRYSCRIPGDLLNSGRYTLNLHFARDSQTLCWRKESILSFEVFDTPTMRGPWFGQWGGIVRPRLEWQAQMLDGDAANAPLASSAAQPSRLALK